MALSNEDILNAIAEMSVMDVVELVRQWKKSLVCLHSCCCGCCAPAAGGDDAAAAEQTEFDVVLALLATRKLT